MSNTLFQGIFDTNMTSVISISDFLLCVGCALVIGLILAGTYMYGTKYTKSFVATLALLPAVVCVVIMMVNGNVGTGVAVAGAFSLVRFRSFPGTAWEIGVIFLDMAIGLATGMGYVTLAVLFFVIAAAVILILSKARFGSGATEYRTLKITIPENLDYENLFDDLLDEYTVHYELERVKTTNMGTLYELQYRIALKSNPVPKAFLDEIRCRNGNLNISCGREISEAGL